VSERTKKIRTFLDESWEKATARAREKFPDAEDKQPEQARDAFRLMGMAMVVQKQMGTPMTPVPTKNPVHIEKVELVRPRQVGARSHVHSSVLLNPHSAKLSWHTRDPSQRNPSTPASASGPAAFPRQPSAQALGAGSNSMGLALPAVGRLAFSTSDRQTRNCNRLAP
jgi:hypothetical protein